jgi:ATP-dependent helicase YprA (DUF1998 family)
MNVFSFRNQIIEDYNAYVSSFISISQPRLREFVDRCFTSGSLWPDPLIQLNPTFKPGKTVDELVNDGVLESGCSQIFRRDKTALIGGGEDLLFHQHQEEAILKGKAGRNYVLTTGTGSGKSLSYIVPIVDHVLRTGSGRGIQAIIIYPMNALANSQFGELEKFLKHGFPDGLGPVTFERYTGQEDEETRTRIITKPPDILLTNYVMLELILTRPREKKLIASAHGLKFLVLDELHTYRGRQGADVALLLRRVRELLAADAMQCVGTGMSSNSSPPNLAVTPVTTAATRNLPMPSSRSLEPNCYGFDYALGMNFLNKQSGGEMLWPEDLDEIAKNGRNKYGCRIV